MNKLKRENLMNKDRIGLKAQEINCQVMRNRMIRVKRVSCPGLEVKLHPWEARTLTKERELMKAQMLEPRGWTNKDRL